MSKSSVKPKAAIIWSEQTEKLRKKFSLTEAGLDIEQGEMGKIISRLRQKLGTRLEMI